MPGIFEIMLIGLVCFNLGNALGYKRHASEHHKKPDKQIVINDSTGVVNIYIDKHGHYWSDPRFTMSYRWGIHSGTRVIVFHKGCKSWKKGFNKKRWNRHLRKKRKNWG